MFRGSSRFRFGVRGIYITFIDTVPTACQLTGF